MIIRHRKNSLYYRTERGAWVGDLFMSFIHTCDLMEVNAFEYLTALLRNGAGLSADPSRWMPWNYRQTLSVRGKYSLRQLVSRIPKGYKAEEVGLPDLVQRTGRDEIAPHSSPLQYGVFSTQPNHRATPVGPHTRHLLPTPEREPAPEWPN